MVDAANGTGGPSAWKGTVGVLALLVYFAGSLGCSLVFFRIVVDPEASLWAGLERLSWPIALVAAGLVLQVVRQAGEKSGTGSPEARTRGLSDLKWPLGLLVVPVVVAWLQFELFRPRIWMWPLLSLIGGIWLGVVLGGFAGRGRFASALTMLIVAVFTLPLAVLSVAMPARHFRNHGTPVLFLGGDEYDPREYPLEATLPDAPVREMPTLGPGTAELLNAFAEARPVEGKMIDGEFHLRDERGNWVEAEEGSLEQMFEDAAALDAAAEAEAEAAYMQLLEAHERKLDHVRNSGRIFSSPPDPASPSR